MNNHSQQPDLKGKASRNGEGESAGVSKNTTGYLDVASLKSIPLLTPFIREAKVGE